MRCRRAGPPLAPLFFRGPSQTRCRRLPVPTPHSHALCGSSRVAVVAEYFDYHVPSLLSLSVIIALLLVGTLASLHHNRKVAANGGGSADDGLGSPMLTDVV